MKEYMVHIWGGAWNDDAHPSIKQDLGIDEGYYYFSTEKEKDLFLEKVRQKKYQDLGIVFDIKHKEMTHKRTIFVGDFMFQNKIYKLRYDFGYEYEKQNAEFMFLEGNYSCDCNRSILLLEKYNDFPLLGCGDNIKLVNYKFRYED
nr:MAG TPA: hypothetical protein [Caudoviricetes sp.]